MLWMMRPRHWRRVWLAARRVGSCDERSQLDDWITHNLKRVRREALAAGMSQDEIDDVTFEGMAAGRSEA